MAIFFDIMLLWLHKSILRDKHPFTNSVKFQINNFLFQVVINFAFSYFLL